MEMFLEYASFIIVFILTVKLLPVLSFSVFEMIRVFDLTDKFGNSFLFAEIFVHNNISDVYEFANQI